jgi:SAM-dependent methyltransferase
MWAATSVKRVMNVELEVFRDRSERSRYVARRYRDALRGKLLDVGCDRAQLRTLLPEVEYTGVDIAGAPDIQLNLELADRLPFPESAFDCVVCTDVLEHLDNLHQIFGELLRVTRRDVVLSLPSNWVNARVPIQRGHGSFKHYGLPPDKPADRHKWFFPLTDALRFVEVNAPRGGCVIREVHAMEKPRPWLLRALRRMRYPRQMCYLNRYAHTVWFHLEKHAPAGSPA